MKHLYWRPQRQSHILMVLLAVYALTGLWMVEHFQRRKEQPHYTEKMQAARAAADMFSAVKAERLRRGFKIDPDTDPMGSALIGSLMSPVTSNTGSLAAKQTSINPNFAAVIVQLLKRAGVKEGDHVAVAYSGSFPALNMSVAAATKVLKLKPISISSSASSQWGANDPQFLWVDMEEFLFERKMLPTRSVAASLGGIEDRALGMSKEGKNLLLLGIERAGLPLIRERTFPQSLDAHMATYQDRAEGHEYKAYINVGGGMSSVGSKIGRILFRPGLNTREPVGIDQVDSVMSRFIQSGVPVIHLSQISELAKRYGLPVQPTKMPRVGEGKIFIREEFNPYLVWSMLASLLAALFAFLRLELGLRLQQGGASSDRLEASI